MTSAQPDLWERSVLRYALVGLVCLQAAGLVVVFDWSGRSLEPFDQTKMVFGRIVEGLTLVVVALSLSRFGTVIVPRTRLHAAVVALVGANVVAAIFAQDQYIALYGSPTRYLGLAFVFEMALLYLGAAVALRRDRDWTALALAVGAAIVITAGYALVQYTRHDPLAWTMNDPTSRPFATTGNADVLGHFLSVGVAAAAGVALLYQGRSSRVVRGAAVTLAVLGLLVSGIAATRASALGLGLAAVALPFVYVRSRQRHGLRKVLALEAVALLVLLPALAASPLGSRLAASLAGTGLQERILVWDAALHALRDRPLFGYGPDNFAVVWPVYRPAALTALSPGLTNDSAHSWPLQAAATTGAVGLCALVVLVAAVATALYGRALVRSPLAGGVLLLALTAYVGQATVTVGSTATDWVPWLVAGAAAATAGTVRPALRARKLGPALIAPAIACALVFAGIGWRALDANREGFATKKAADLGQGQIGIEHGIRAVELDGGRAEYWNELGRAYFAARRFADASDAFQSAHERGRYDSTYLSNLARSLTRLTLERDSSRGGTAAALAAARRAVATDPNDINPHEALADVAAALGQPDEALTATLDARWLVPLGRYETTASTLAAKATDLTAARAALERSVQRSDSAVLRVALGRVALRQGDRAAALENAARALQLSPQLTDAFNLVRDAGG